MVEGAGLEALALHGGRIPRSRRLMVLTGTSPRQAVADGGGAGHEVPAVGVQSVERGAPYMIGAEGAEARSGKEDHGW